MLEAGLADPRLAGTTMTASIWDDGVGVVAARNPDLALHPASNEKLFTAAAVLAVLGADTTLDTRVLVTPAGDLVLVGGGDPALASRGPHSLDDLAAQVRARGITDVAGALVGDESRYDAIRTGPGWGRSYVPAFSGSLSALTVDRNQHRPDPGFLAQPVPANVELFRAALARQGVRVGGPTVQGTAPEGSEVVAALSSAQVGQLVGDMLTTSDNLAAELLLKEAGYRTTGTGSTAAGAATVAGVAGALGLAAEPSAGDGSGLGRQNARSGRAVRTLLQAALDQPWASTFTGGLPLAGHTGTLQYRFRATPAHGTVRAKTGYVPGVHALSGYLTTAGDRLVVFALVVNDTGGRLSVRDALDGLVVAMAADRSSW